MKKLSFTVLLFSICLGSWAQKNNAFATISGTITDYQSNIINGQVILFENQSSNKTYSTTSNEKGNFQTKLPCNANYLIKIKGFNDAKEYTLLEIPALDPDQKSASFEIDIKYEPSKKFTLDNVYFDVGKATITKKSYAELNKLVAYLKLKKNERIEIGGHTDNVGENADNILLSQKRADVIMRYLIKKGIQTSRLKAVGYGENIPRASNDTKEGRRLNRRTEVKKIN
jgi:outer membrane protein OmpA-like peptidoglycan-associated protein